MKTIQNLPSILISIAALSFFLFLNTYSNEYDGDDWQAIKYNKDLLVSTPFSDIWWHDSWGQPLNHVGIFFSYSLFNPPDF